MSGRRGYVLVTGAYWGFTLTDGALRMLVLLHFHTLGYSPFSIALLFLFYEVFGVVTNLLGGWIGARMGLRVTLYAGLALQVAALLMLAGLDAGWTAGGQVAWVMISQAVSGIAKDLTKMSSKSAVKLLAADGSSSSLFKWVAVLTGSKNALKGVGFFLGGVLLTALGFVGALLAMAGALGAVLMASMAGLSGDLGRAKEKAKFAHLLSKTREINILSAARFFLFGARDVWFVVALPVFLADVAHWSFTEVGGFLAVWVIGYGAVQSVAPKLAPAPHGGTAYRLALALAAIPAAISIALGGGFSPVLVVAAGLLIFGVVFAVNSAVHSYLILHYSDHDKVALNVGFYYMANAGGRLSGTVLSGAMYQAWGLSGCLWASAAFVLAAAVISAGLPRN